jgi:predicted dehydrogenase
MSKQIGIGFIGAGGNTRLRHLPGFAGIEGVRLVTVANRSIESSQAVAEAFDMESVSPDWKAVIEHPDVDAVCIGTWPYMHAEMTVSALRAGKHVLTEARMASNLSEARAMHAESMAHPDRVCQIVPSPFTLDFDKAIIGLLQAGTLGDLTEVFVDHSHGLYLDPDALMTWRQDPHYSGNNMLTMGIYHETVQRWLPDPCSVDHVSSGIVTKERIHWETGELSQVALPDFLHILGHLERGTVLNYHFSGVEPGPGRNAIKLVGTKATLVVDLFADELILSQGDEPGQPILVPAEDKPGWRVEADFIESIREGKPVELTSFADGVRYMEFTDAVYSRLPSLSC